ncbi:hypothetical protein C3L33_06977, partial [Rhododendron williamsianum]
VRNMGKHLRMEPDDELFEDRHPGCMWGIIHALDYHHWQNTAKKMLPYKRHNGSTHTKGHGRPKALLDVHDSDEVQKHLDAEGSRYLIDPTATGTSSTNKRWSLKAHLKALISDETSRKETSGRRDSLSQRTYSIHHLEPSDSSPLGKIIRSRPIIFVHRTSKSDTKKRVSSNEKFNVGGTENISEHLEPRQLPENHTFCPEKCEKAEEGSVNQWEEYVDVLFRVNKDSVLKIQKDTDDDIVNCLCDLPGSSKNARLTKSGSFPSADLSRLRNFRPSKLKHKQTEVWSFPKGENLSSGTHEIEGSVNDLCNVKPTRIRRTPSMDTSLERYTQLFQNSFSREAKLHASKSLKLTNDYEFPSGGQAPKFFKRVRSLSHLDFNCSLQNELSSDAQFSGVLVNTIVDSSKKVDQNSHGEQKPFELPVSTEKYVSAQTNNETERRDSRMKKDHVASLLESIKEDSTVSTVGLGEEFEEQTVGENSCDEELEIQSFSQEDLTSPDDFQTLEGSECKSGTIDEQESPFEAEYRSLDTSSWSCNTAEIANIEITNKGVKNQRHAEFNSDFDYVSIILHLSGFDGNGFLEQWHSLDQPLNPLVFEEVETCWPHETELSGDKISARHQLLFDLTNEVLLQIYESSFTYYPRELSLGCRIRPSPSRFLEEVWAELAEH